MKSVFLSLVALVLLAGTMFAATPNAIIVPEVPVVTVPLAPTPSYLGLVFATTAEPATPAQSQAKILADLQAVSVLVKVHGGSGSGTLVTRQVGDVTKTYVWTAGHVVREEMQKNKTFSNVTICQEFRNKGKSIGKSEVQARVIAYSDPEMGEDLALLEILQDNFRPTTISAKFDLTAELQDIGTKLIHVGCTQGLYNSVSYGVISQTDIDLLKTGKMFEQTSTMAYPGSSGGGMYLEDGTYIGMLTRGGGAGLNFIVPMRRILPWAKSMKCEWALDPKVKVTTPKLFDGTESVPQVDPMDQIRSCIRDIIGDIIDGDKGSTIAPRHVRPYHKAA
jgi:S1-C subfamily serine protease